MNKVLALMAVLALLGLSITASANVFNLGAGFKNLETVTVGNPGNVGEVPEMGGGPYGSVSYTYNIGKYEVTVKQYCDFLNAKAKTDNYGLYNSYMWDDPHGCKITRSGDSGNYSYSVQDIFANRPVNYVSYWDACRFANWLNNGQGNGDTETGAYTLNGYNGNDGRAIKRNTNVKWAVTSENEWYKAAYYKGGGTNAGYWDYANKSDSMKPWMANYDGMGTTGVGTTTEVGWYGSTSAYGTFDQNGNVREWNESIEYLFCRVLRGGSFTANYLGVLDLQSSYKTRDYPGSENSITGFRVVSLAPVPEPSSILVLAGGLISLLGIRRRRS